jgi:hypothetical protein
MNINDIIVQDGIIYDRYLGTTLSLPYSSFESIKIQPNETVTNFNINSVISKLHENYLYLYKSAHVASNIIPITSVAMAGVYNGAFNWYRGLSSTQFNAISSVGLNIDFSNVLAVKYNNDLKQYVLATTTGTDIIFLKSNSTFTSITTALSTNVTFQGSNVRWQKIQDIIFGDNNAMYVLDQKANSITQYDASGFLTNDNILQNILVYQNSVGGYGTYADNTKFNVPHSIDYFNSTLYVLDKDNNCIKTYDRNLNWLLTYRLFKDFLSAGPIHLSHDQYGNNYVLNDNWTVYKYSNNFNTKEILDFTSLSAAGDRVRRVIFSQSDSNVFYFVTKNYIYKKLVNTPYDTIGNYLLSRFKYDSNEQFTAFATISSAVNGINYDYNFGISKAQSPAGGKISLFQDNLNVTSVLTNDVFDVYSLDEIDIDKEEYLQNWVINKSISKLLMNHMRLRDNISSKFLYDQNTIAGDTLLAGTRYLLPNELNSLLFNQDITNFIGVNEIFQNNIINRPFEIIFNIQKNLLLALAADVRDYNATPQIVYLS